MRVEVKENETQKALIIDGAIQGVCDKEGNPLSPYMGFVKEVGMGLKKPSPSSLFLGGGAFILPSYFVKKLNHKVTCYEINIWVRDKAWTYFDLDDHEMRIKDEDALNFTEKEQDFIFLDCYDGAKPVSKLYNTDFFVKCKKALAKDGIFSCNYCGTDVEINKMSKLLAGVFNNVKMRLIAMDQDYKSVLQAVYFCL